MRAEGPACVDERREKPRKSSEYAGSLIDTREETIGMVTAAAFGLTLYLEEHSDAPDAVELRQLRDTLARAERNLHRHRSLFRRYLGALQGELAEIRRRT